MPAETTVAGATAEIADTSRLACYTCKRRKVKCDRILPQCFLCLHTGASCEYPTGAEKPGPKLGSVNKNKRQRQASATSERRRQSRDAATDTAKPPSERGRLASNELRRVSISQTMSQPVTVSSSNSEPVRQVIFGSPGESSSGRATGSMATAMSDFSQITYPSHDPQTRPQSPTERNLQPSATRVDIDSLCNGLGITRGMFEHLVEAYYENMTAFSLVIPHGLEEKLQSITSVIHARALAAAMFAISARFYHPTRLQLPPGSACPSPSHFADLTSKLLATGLEQCGDKAPPLCLLQASVLHTFYHLTRGVQHRAWQLLGSCVRLAYELRLHLIDVEWKRDPDKPMELPVDWPLLEEKRRCWWAIWEMDVFASTIRRLPTAIDWQQNFSLLPMPDECWFTGNHQQSCFLAREPNERWKALSQVGNTSPRSWFIVINSFMHDVHLLVYNPSRSVSGLSDADRDDLTMISNSLYCAMASLPSQLKFKGQLLDFQTARETAEANRHQFHSDIYAIHAMSQLAQFMIFQHTLCSRATSPAKHHELVGSPARDITDQTSWANYMKACEAIVSLVRSSDPDHVQHLNPFLNNTLWFAAAGQIACVVLGPASYSRALARSNYEILALTIDRLNEFWESMDMLRPRLQKIESALQNLPQTALPRQSGSGAWPGSASGMMPHESNASVPHRVDGLQAENEDYIFGCSQDALNNSVGMQTFMPLLEQFDELPGLDPQAFVDGLDGVFPLGWKT